MVANPIPWSWVLPRGIHDAFIKTADHARRYPILWLRFDIPRIMLLRYYQGALVDNYFMPSFFREYLLSNIRKLHRPGQRLVPYEIHFGGFHVTSATTVFGRQTLRTAGVAVAADIV